MAEESLYHLGNSGSSPGVADCLCLVFLFGVPEVKVTLNLIVFLHDLTQPTQRGMFHLFSFVCVSSTWP